MKAEKTKRNIIDLNNGVVINKIKTIENNFQPFYPNPSTDGSQLKTGTVLNN
jgi:hypothetical protein